MKLVRRIFSAAIICIFVVSLSVMGAIAKTGDLKLDRSQIENIVQRSYQYIAMYNVINKAAMAPGPTSTGGWNKIKLNTQLADANLKAIARPNNDTLYQIAMLDLRNEPVIPNLQNKYSIGENAGFKLNADGGIKIYVAAQKPAGVPDENWLPINRGDQDLDIILRLYLPDPLKMKTWNKPKVVLSR